jgi:hypothetical protein
VLRSLSLLPLLSLAACSTASAPAPERQFVLADPAKYKTEAEKQQAALIAQNGCKVKAIADSAEIEKSIASERRGMENLYRAREKAAEMYTSSFTLCMVSAGYRPN